jgi:hypothetical protein
LLAKGLIWIPSPALGESGQLLIDDLEVFDKFGLPEASETSTR